MAARANVIAPTHRKARAPSLCSHPALTDSRIGGPTGGAAVVAATGRSAPMTMASGSVFDDASGSGPGSGMNGGAGGGGTAASTGVSSSGVARAGGGSGCARDAATSRLRTARSAASRSFWRRRPDVRTSAMMAISGVPSAQAIPTRMRKISSTKAPGSPCPGPYSAATRAACEAKAARLSRATMPRFTTSRWFSLRAARLMSASTSPSQTTKSATLPSLMRP